MTVVGTVALISSEFARNR